MRYSNQNNQECEIVKIGKYEIELKNPPASFFGIMLLVVVICSQTDYVPLQETKDAIINTVVGVLLLFLFVYRGCYKVTKVGA